MKHPLNSLLFLSEARKSICELFDDFQVDDLELAKNFIMNEATDNQIISILTTGQFSLKESTIEEEEKQWDTFKRWLNESSSIISEVFDGYNDIIEEVLDEVVFEMGPVSNLSLSSASPILEFHTESGYLYKVIQEEDKKKKDSLSTRMYQKTGQAVEKAGQGAQATGKAISNIATGLASGGVETAKQTASSVKQKTKEKLQSTEGGRKALEKYRDIKKSAGEKIEDVKATTKGTATKDQQASAFKTVASTAAIGAVGAYAAKKLFDRYFSKAAKKCKGLSFGERSACIKQAKAEAKAAAKARSGKE